MLNPDDYPDDDGDEVERVLQAAKLRVQSGQTAPAWMAGIKACSCLRSCLFSAK